jgi:hypothetical protein
LVDLPEGQDGFPPAARRSGANVGQLPQVFKIIENTLGFESAIDNQTEPYTGEGIDALSPIVDDPPDMVF